MKTDTQGEIINHEETYNSIVAQLKTGNGVLIGWTDEKGTHYDILFTLRPIQSGVIQGGITGVDHLFVSVMRVGAFAFRLDNQETQNAYVSEKLSINGEDTLTKITELINEVKKLI